MTDAAASPLRVGLIGCGRPGLHLIERFTLGGPFRVVAAFANPTVASVVSPFGVKLVSHPQELLAAEDVDVVWFSEHDAFRHEFSAAEALRRKHVIVETPLALSSADAERAFEAATQNRRVLLVRHPRRTDPDFQQAQSVAQDSTLGSLRAAKFVSWTYGLPPRGVTRGHGPLPQDASYDPRITTLRFAVHALDQLLALVNDRPLRVFATTERIDQTTPDLTAGLSLALQIAFERGCHAAIDIRLNSPAQFQSGWLLTSERGGYANGKRFTLTEEGEVFDAPVAAAVGRGPDADQFEWLAQQIRRGERDSVEEARVRMVVALLDAAQRSLASRQAETL